MMYIFEVPEGLDVTQDEVLQQAIASVGGQWPEPILPATQPVDGRQIVLVYAEASKADITELLLAFGLDWDILATEGEPVDQSALIPFFTDVVTIDEDGVETVTPVTDLTDKLQVFSGHSWTY